MQKERDWKKKKSNVHINVHTYPFNVPRFQNSSGMPMEGGEQGGGVELGSPVEGELLGGVDWENKEKIVRMALVHSQIA